MKGGAGHTSLEERCYQRQKENVRHPGPQGRVKVEEPNLSF